MGAGCLVQDSYTLKGKDLLYIIGISDIHRGNPGCNEEYLDYWLKMVSKIKNPKIIIDVGDPVEVGSKHIGNSAFKQNKSLDTQIIETEEFFDPLVDDLAFLMNSNHNKRTEREFDLSLNRLMAHHLDLPYGNQYHQTFMINGKPFTIYANHGKGSNAYAHLAQGRLIRETSHVDADLVLQGHNHRLDFFTHPIRDLNTDKGMKRRYYAFTGAFLNYDGYPDEMLLPPLPPAFQFLTVDKNLNVWNIPYYIDQRRPDLMEDFNELAYRRT